MKMNDPDGSPLAVCINDCEIDYGQPGSELAKVCFRLGCAFAEMRWGNTLGKAEPAKEKVRAMKFLPILASGILVERW
ncbi:MAG TPA: hypothetical protein VE262_12720 [Blastocatellia bacterium]|nr:hypothetical protein [Blastocatellia bacterium]